MKLKIIIYSIVLAIIFNFIGTFYASYTEKCQPLPCLGGPISYRGFPLNWLRQPGLGILSFTNLIVDITFWFAISFVIMFVYFKIRRK